MTYKIVSHKDPEFEKDFGGYNFAPPNMVPITEYEFKNAMFTRNLPEFIDYRQVCKKMNADGSVSHIDGPMMALTMYIFDAKRGVAVSTKYVGSCEGRSEYEFSYFKFAVCDHDMEGLSVEECRKSGIYHAGNCYHVSRCKKCGYVTAVDSSD